MRLARSQRRTGTRRPQRGSVGRVRLYNVTDDAVVDGYAQSGCAGWAEGRDPAAARPPRRRGAADPAWRVALDDEAFVVEARVGVRSVVQPGVDHAHPDIRGHGPWDSHGCRGGVVSLPVVAGGRSPRKEDSPATYLPKVFFGEISNLTAGLRHFG